MWLQDGVKMDVYVLGIKEHLQKNVSTTSSGCVVWDPLKKHSLVSKKGTGLRKRMDGQPRRPPNAFILYRKDQHPEIKRMYPEIHNNEISILTGSMWKSESEEIRQKYHLRAMAIKKALPALAELGGHLNFEAPVMQRVVSCNTASSSPVPSKKKVNGFIGFRSYYSPLFSRYPQKQRSPFMTTLWKQDAFHNEWEFMCSTYSVIRSLLADEGITLQMWISFSVGPLGIVKRDEYMRAMRWTLVQHADGAPRLQRISIPTVERTAQPTDSLSLFHECVKAGLRVSDPAKVVAQLSGSGGDVLCINANDLPQMIHDRAYAHRAPPMPPTTVLIDESEFDALFRVGQPYNAAGFQGPATNDTANEALMPSAEVDMHFFDVSQFHN
ncbi:mating-type protein MAT alpha 1-domain-containing protein [Immersiella caudata]|uniref:Mating-type protein MAT alpha 1-domain-containing protein n=1 Tax=Immersiella caudata TaxID=314043 RepID=A0AA40CCS4_9PEZI|nr:mating-type protein MAT alpha 1-domain-containing protein [Immersiella caudata]